MKSRRRGVDPIFSRLALVWVASACVTPPLSYVGKTCTTTCPEALVCQQGFCRAPSDAAVEEPCTADLVNDQGNCGWCRHDCRGLGCQGGVCGGGELFQAAVQSMVVGGGSLFYASDSAVYAHSLTQGGGSSVTLSNFDNAAFAVSVHPPDLVWCNAEGRVKRALLDGGSLRTVATDTGCRCSAVNSTHAYWWAQADRRPYRAPVDGGPAEQFFPFTNASSEGCVRANDQRVATSIDSAVAVRDLRSGDAVQITARGPIAPSLLALTSTDVFFVTGEDAGQVLNRSQGLSGIARILVKQPSIVALAADDQGVFWNGADGYVYGCADPSCPAGARRYAHVVGVTHLAVDATWLYVAAHPAGAPAKVLRYAR